MYSRKKAQTTIILMFMVVLIFGMLFVFLFSFAESVSSQEHMEKYTYNLLLSLVRTDTGFTDDNCKTISDSIHCALLQPTVTCDQSTIKCQDLANDRITYYIDSFESIKQSYRYFFKVEPQGFIPRDSQNNQIKIEIGDPTVEDADDKIQVSYTIAKTLGTQQFILKAILILARAE